MAGHGGDALAVAAVIAIVLLAVWLRARAEGFAPYSACGANSRVYPSGGPAGPAITPNGAAYELALRRAGAPPYTGTLPPIRLRGCVGAE